MISFLLGHPVYLKPAPHERHKHEGKVETTAKREIFSGTCIAVLKLCLVCSFFEFVPTLNSLCAKIFRTIPTQWFPKLSCRVEIRFIYETTGLRALLEQYNVLYG